MMLRNGMSTVEKQMMEADWKWCLLSESEAKNPNEQNSSGELRREGSKRTGLERQCVTF